MNSHWTRRDLLKTLGLGIAGYSVALNTAEKPDTPGRFIPIPAEDFVPERPVTAIVIGAGSRGNAYSDYGLKFPEELNIVGMADPVEIRRQRFGDRHEIDADKRFATWEDVFERPKFADAVFITTPDDLHYGPCMAALEMGYDVLLEKPISPSEQECRDILKKTQETGRVVAVCHVLRYAPYFRQMQALLRTDAIGEIISMQHFEPIEHVHMAHSFVRGNWHNSATSTPIILSKSSHDLDIMHWLIGKPSKRIAAFGDLKWFREANAPAGSTARCADGCAIEADCPYSALRIYQRNRKWLYVFDLPENPDEVGPAIDEYLATTNYGRCVYRMENDQPDHYVCALEFENNITATFNMEGFTSYHGRRTRVMGSMGDITGDMYAFTLSDFRTGESRVFTNEVEEIANYEGVGHGGGDWLLIKDFVKAVSKQDPTLLTSTIEASIESHLMGFAAEESRTKGQVVPITL